MPATTSPNTLATATDNGRNIRAELMPESFFFLDKNVVFSQSPDDKFGVVGSGSSSIFRTTSKIQYTGKVFTICQGQIFVQPTTGNDTKVNVILKPFSQPVKGLAIKYIIYRGLDKSDFFSADGKVVSNNATAFTTYIWQDFKKFNPNVPDFMQEYIGYPALQPDVNQEQKVTDLIDDYFFKVSQAKQEYDEITEDQKFAYELPLIPRGTHIGNVSGGQYLGIDIVLNEGDYTIKNDPNPFKLNLEFARSADHALNPSIGSTDFKKKLIKESASWFIDIAAFYGLHTQGKGKVYINTQTDPLTDKDGIYDLISNFKTANTVYLYIQSNRQRSYNFYGNYQMSATNFNNIKIGTTADNLLEKEFGTDGWPVEIINNAFFSGRLITDYNISAGLYVKMGLLNEATNHEDYFIRSSNLLSEDNTDPYTKSFGFTFSKTTDNKPVSSFVQLIYEGTLLPVTIITDPTTQDTGIIYMKDIDDVFGLIDAEPHIKKKTDYELHYVIDQNLLLINFANKAGGQDIATVTTKRVEDLVVKDEENTIQRVTYETLLNNIRQNTGSYFQSNSAYKDNSNSGTLSFDKGRNNYYRPESPYYLQTEVFTGSNTITGLSLHVQDGTLPSKKLLGVTKDENNKFTATGFNNPKFFFKNEMNDEEDYYTSSEGTQYRRYSLCVIGEDENGDLEFFEPTVKVYVTTIDQVIFASEEYAKWLPIANDNENIIKPLDIKIYE